MSFQPAFPVRTKRLTLSPLTLEDAEELLAYRSVPEVCRYVPFGAQTKADIEEGIRRRDGSRIVTAGDALMLGVRLESSGVLVGDVMLRWISDPDRGAEIGYVFHPEHSGNGYATEACRALFTLAFEGLDAHRVIARIDARNSPSIRVATRLGMRQEAHLVENEWFKGEWSDELDFAILDREWRSAQPGPLTT